MQLKLQSIPEHSIRVIAVPGELLKYPVSDYTHIECNGKIYEVYTEIIHNKGEIWSTALPLLSTGQSFNEKMVFDKYKDSDRIVFFVCGLANER